MGEEERKEERKEGSKEREKRKRKERGRGRKGGQIDCRSPHVKLCMNFHYLQINSGAFVWLPRLLMFPHLLPPFLSIFNLLQHKTIFGVLNGYSFPGLGLGYLAWDSFTIPSVPVTWLTLPYPQDFSVKLSPLLAYPSPSLQPRSDVHPVCSSSSGTVEREATTYLELTASTFIQSGSGIIYKR